MKAHERRIEYLSLASLAAAKRNPKTHDTTQLGASIGRFGYVEPIVLDERTGRLVAGHGRMKTVSELKKTGAAPPEGVRVDDGDWLLPVVRGWSSRSDEDADAYLLASNQLTMVGGWDQTALAEMAKELHALGALEGTGFDGADLDALLARVESSGPTPGEDDVPEESQGAPWIQRGDLFALGEHRIACADSAAPGALDLVLRGERAAICWTDPPWNVAFGESTKPAGWSRRSRRIANDNLGDGFPAFCRSFAARLPEAMQPGALLYLAMSAQEWPVIDAALREAGFHWSSTLIWSKDTFVPRRKDYHTQYEPIWYGWLDGAPRLVQVADRSQSDVWCIDRPRRSDEHPTMKPVQLVVRALENSSEPGAIVLDPFSGSGTTLIAAEQTRRRARVVELEPRYVQVAIERWEKFTGKKAEKLS